ncbi:alpha/beta fold hydrolase [Microbacterium murale]|uniref:Pimeloyl-ACP methyl ester carboxylesterase n=1 Tax=Microbacterium murale TaxID=1081040 RepID=A0ABU0PFB4_9MICO|nr:alpha/beta hydrolase [Microbacterium murale]MDQ0645386.1 pimeloyl-ACP methyl ester carboxylesterase [Microbacterium murale]
MDILLIPGLWLDDASWTDISPALEAAGHRPVPMTMPGVGQPAELSAGIGIADWVRAVVAQIDATKGPVVLVGHSGGGNVVWGAADARPDRVSRVVFVDTVPPPPGSEISEFPVVEGVIPFPGWEYFPDEDVYDIDAATRARTLPQTRSVPARVPTDPILLTGERHRVPVTLLMGSLSQDELEAQIDRWGPYGDEYHSIDDATVLKIGSGHWPQFTQPARLAELISSALTQ